MRAYDLAGGLLSTTTFTGISLTQIQISGMGIHRVEFWANTIVGGPNSDTGLDWISYPTPVDGGLGVHVTLDMAGRMRFGPDVEWVTEENYAVDPRRADSFYARIRSYWPGLPDGTLVPDYSGIRPKLRGPGEPQADFLIAGPADHGMPRLVNLFGIESPGLTASLSLAEDVVQRLD